MSLEEKRDEMVNVAMQIILHAGDAKMFIDEAFDCLKVLDFANAAEKLDNADKEIILAHTSQTELIQAEIADSSYPNCLLFNHAQDTLMTTMTYYSTALNVLEVVKIINNKIESINK